jgi:hypothetical protein
MTKHKLNKRTRTIKRIQKGGNLLNPFTWFQGDDWGGWFSNIGSKASNTTNNLLSSANNALGSASNSIVSGTQNAFQSASNILNSDVPLTTPSPPLVEPVLPSPLPLPSYEDKPVIPENNTTLTPPISQPVVHDLSIGGKRRRKKYTQKGGKNLGLTYYATPVSNMKVAEPTYWEVYANGTNQYNIKGGSKKKNKKHRKTQKNKKHKKN